MAGELYGLQQNEQLSQVCFQHPSKEIAKRQFKSSVQDKLEEIAQDISK